MSEEQIKPGYKKTEVGVIPEDWEVNSLSGFVNYKNGAAHEKSITDSGRFIVVNSKFISSEGATRKYSNDCFCQASRGDVLMVMSDVPNGKAIAKCYWVEYDETYTVNQRICVLSPKLVDGKFLFYKLDRNNFYLAFDDGAKQTNLRKDEVLACPLGVPQSLTEQRAIATTLSDVDVLLAQLDQLIAKKRDLKQATMQQLLTGQTRLPGFSGAWQVKRLGDVLTYLGNGAVYEPTSSFGLPVTRIETIADGTVDFSKVGYAVPSDELKKYRLKKGDILFSHINSIDHIGKVAIYESDIALYHGMNLLLLRPTEAITSRYLFYWLGSNHGRKHSATLAKQAVSQASINTVELKGIEVPLPTVSEQTAIATILSAMDTELATLQARRDKTHALKQGMMQELLTGRIRLI